MLITSFGRPLDLLKILPIARYGGSWLRAEPVAAMDQQSRFKHGDPPPAALEHEMCDFGLEPLSLRGRLRGSITP